jgi:hypothetical protein
MNELLYLETCATLHWRQLSVKWTKWETSHSRSLPLILLDHSLFISIHFLFANVTWKLFSRCHTFIINEIIILKELMIKFTRMFLRMHSSSPISLLLLRPHRCTIAQFSYICVWLHFMTNFLKFFWGDLCSAPLPCVHLCSAC